MIRPISENMAKFTLKMMSDDDGREFAWHYSDLIRANEGFRQALRRHGTIIIGLFDEDDRRIQTDIEASLKRRASDEQP